MDTDFNPDTQMLALKPEYSLQQTEIYIAKPAFGGLVYKEIRIFDPSVATEAEYEEYWHRGFSFIFDAVSKI